ncbi:hypothetical protein EDC01DRAFT_620589 [Geopyxis carbonaria]|nr:hypothetical protein EDC01DRAFT_620589 [Geopyxis carbonaria]
MKFLDSMFNAFLTRDQRERHSRNKWDKSVAQAARDLGLEAANTPRYVPTTPASSCPPSPTLSHLKLDTSIPTSYPMTPSLSSASSSSASSGINSPTRSRPGTAYSTSPRPEFRRHTSIARQPISYDALISSKPEKQRRASSDAAPATQQLLYPLPPLGPMEGIGKYRRSVDVTDDYLSALNRNTIAALQPFIANEDRISRFRRGENKDTTTPPRAYSTSPPVEDILRRQRAIQSDLERWACELEEDFEDIEIPDPSSGELVARNNSRPVRVATKRRAQNSRERGRNGARRNTNRAAPAPAVAGGLTKNLKKNGGYKSKAAPAAARASDLSASMETLVSGEE